MLSYWSATGRARVSIDGESRDAFGVFEHAWGGETRIDVAAFVPRRWQWDVLHLGSHIVGDRFFAGLALHGFGAHGAARLEDDRAITRVNRLRIDTKEPGKTWSGTLVTRGGTLRYDARAATPILPEVPDGGFVGFTWSPETYYPTPVCILDSCSPVSDTKLHFCDGPDAPSSPGICMQGFSGSVCLPKCSYDKQGGTPTGCAGKDTCFAYPSSAQNGVGYCWAGCTSDNDCQSGHHCQVDQGICVIGVTPPTKNIGDACTSKDNDTLACYCLYGNNNTGYCSSFCIVGQTGTCPSGFTCDPFEYRAYGYTTPNTGMAGYCTKSCVGDASACPSSSSCTNLSVAGPDCVPP